MVGTYLFLRFLVVGENWFWPMVFCADEITWIFFTTLFITLIQIYYILFFSLFSPPVMQVTRYCCNVVIYVCHVNWTFLFFVFLCRRCDHVWRSSLVWGWIHSHCRNQLHRINSHRVDHGCPDCENVALFNYFGGIFQLGCIRFVSNYFQKLFRFVISVNQSLKEQRSFDTDDYYCLSGGTKSKVPIWVS